MISKIINSQQMISRERKRTKISSNFWPLDMRVIVSFISLTFHIKLAHSSSSFSLIGSNYTLTNRLMTNQTDRVSASGQLESFSALMNDKLSKDPSEEEEQSHRVINWTDQARYYYDSADPKSETRARRRRKFEAKIKTSSGRNVKRNALFVDTDDTENENENESENENENGNGNGNEKSLNKARHYDDQNNNNNNNNNNININGNSSKTQIVALSDRSIELRCPLVSEMLSLSASNQPSSGSGSGSNSNSITMDHSSATNNRLSILWRKNGIKVSSHQLGPRIKVNASNGTLVILSAQPKLDEASYECALISTNTQSKSSIIEDQSTNKSNNNNNNKESKEMGEYEIVKTHRFELTLLVPPHLAPFEFPSDTQIGMKVVLTCSALRGQKPISFVWLKDNQIISSSSETGSTTTTTTTTSTGQSLTNQIKSLAQIHKQQLNDKIALEAAGTRQTAASSSVRQQLDYALLTSNHEQHQQQITSASILDAQTDTNSGLSGNNIKKGKGKHRDQLLLPILSDPNIRIKQADDYSILSIDSLELKHSGRYTCSAQNEASRDTHSAQLIINAPPSFITEPKDSDLVSGQTTLIDCAANGHPRPSISWHRAKESNTQQWDYVPIYDNLRYTSLPNGSLALTNVTKSEQGYYMCTAKNGFGPEVTKLIKLTVHEPAKFGARFKTLEVQSKAQANLLCIGSGEAPLKIEWLDKDGNQIDRDHKRFIIEDQPQDLNLPQAPIDSHVVASRFVILKSDRADSGHYHCHATNKFGSDRMVINLLVQDVPDKVLDLKASNVTSSTISLRWQLLFHGNAPITEYYLQYQADDPLDDLLNPLSTNDLFFSSGQSIDADKQLRSQDRDQMIATGLSESQSSLKRALDAISVMSSLGEDPVEGIDRTLYEKRYNQSANHLVVENLTPFCVYKLRVAAINKIGLGEFSDWIRVKTEEATPIDSAIKMRAIATGPNSIKLTWLPPDRTKWNGQLIGFNIGYRPRDSAFELNKTVEWQAPSLQMMVRDASQSESKSIHSENGNTNEGLTIHSELRTIFSALKNSSRQVATSQGVISNSLLDRGNNKNTDNNNNIGHSYKLLKQRLRQLLTLLEKEQLAHLTNLQRSTTYLVWIQAINNRGFGPRSQTITVKTLDDVPPSAPDVHIQSSTTTSITITWRLQSNFISPANQYSLYYRKIPQIRGSQASATNLNSSSLSSSLMLSNIPLVEQSSLIARGQEQVPFIECTILSQHLVVTGNLFLGIDQDSSMDGAEPLIKSPFLHSHQQQPQHYQQFVYTLGQLECGSYYELYMTTRNSVGKSEPSNVVETSTMGEPPVAPANKNNLFTRIGINDVILNLASWSSGGCPLTHMSIRYRQAPSPVASANIKSTAALNPTLSSSASDLLASNEFHQSPPNGQQQASSNSSSSANIWPITISIPTNILANLDTLESRSDKTRTAAVSSKSKHQAILLDDTGNHQASSPIYTLRNLLPSSCYELEIVAQNTAGYTRAQYEFVTSSFNDTRGGFSRREGVYRIDQTGKIIFSSLGDSPSGYSIRSGDHSGDHSSFIDQQTASFSGATQSHLDANSLVPLLFMITILVCLLVSSTFCYYRFRDNWKHRDTRSRHHRPSLDIANGGAYNTSSAMSQSSPGSIGKSSMWRINNQLASTLKRHHMSFMQPQHQSDQDQDSPIHYCMRDPANINHNNDNNSASYVQSVSMKDFNLVGPSNGDHLSHAPLLNHHHATTLNPKSFRANGSMRPLQEEHSQRMATSRARLVSSTPYDDLINHHQYSTNTLAVHPHGYSANFKSAAGVDQTGVYQSRAQMQGQTEQAYINTHNGNDYGSQNPQQETSWTTPNYVPNTDINQNTNKLELDLATANYAIPSASMQMITDRRQQTNEASLADRADYGTIDACIQHLLSQQYQQQHQQQQQQHATILNRDNQDNYASQHQNNIVDNQQLKFTTTTTTSTGNQLIQGAGSIFESSSGSSSSGIDIGAPSEVNSSTLTNMTNSKCNHFVNMENHSSEGIQQQEQQQQQQQQ